MDTRTRDLFFKLDNLLYALERSTGKNKILAFLAGVGLYHLTLQLIDLIRWLA